MRALSTAAIFLMLCAGTPAGAQQIAIPEAALRDRVALEQAIPGLANQALGLLPTEPQQRLEYQFRLQLACGNYAMALSSLDELNKSRPPPPAWQTVEPLLREELHARAKVLEAREKIPYAGALTRSLSEKFSKYDDRTAADSAWFLGLPPDAARAILDRQRQQIEGRRSLTPAELMEVIRWYVTLQAVSSFEPTLDAAIAVDDARRFIIDRGVLIKTRDGATIAADVVRPKRLTGPQPAVLHFTIYTSPPINLRDAKDAAVRGYVGVFANARGKYLSTDKIVPWETEVRDTHDVIDWISRQPWSDGKVGMFGNSYEAFVQWAAAKNLHPALKTIVPSAATSPGNGMPMQNNVFQNGQYAWSLQVTNDRYTGDPSLHDRNRWFSLFTKWFESGRPLREIDAIDGTPNEILQRQLRHPSYDAYWQGMQPYEKEFGSINIPVLSLTGYFDDAGSAAVNYLVEHNRYNRKAEHYLVIGPYWHNGILTGWKDPTVNGYAIDPVAQIDTIALIYQWFDYVLRGAPKPALLEDRINYQVLGTNTWRHAPSIAKMANRTLRLYLTNQKVGKRYDLSPQRPAADGYVEQMVDLADRETTINLFPDQAYLDTPDAPTRIAYVSAPFEEPVAVSGMITGELKAAINRRDFDFTWALYEAMPDGKYFNLSYYLGRASYAADRTTRSLLMPGKIASLPFSRTPLTARQLSKGSRLLLLVTVNKNQHAQVNYGTGGDVSDESVADAKPPLEVRWHNASFIDVPLRSNPARPPTTHARD
jgi:putative CocE/NonD family hydrolase